MVDGLQGRSVLQQEPDTIGEIIGCCFHQWSPPLAVWEVRHVPQVGEGLHAGGGPALDAVVESRQPASVDAGVEGVALEEELDDFAVSFSAGPVQCRHLCTILDIHINTERERERERDKLQLNTMLKLTPEFPPELPRDECPPTEPYSVKSNSHCNPFNKEELPLK